MPRRLREHLPSQTYEAGRNTVEGMGYMADQANVLLFSHAVNCKEYGQVPAVLVAFDDGYRSITHDLSGDRSELWQYNNADVARTGRTAHRIPRTMNFYECGRQDETVLLGEEAVIERIVDLHERFGGDRGQLLIFIEHWGQEITLTRPPQMSERYPASVTFVPMPPPELLHYGIDGARAIVEAAIAARKAMREATGTFELEPEGEQPMFAGTKAAVAQALADYEEFCERHYRAYMQFKRGRRNVVFPAGTVFWRLRANVNVERAAA